MWYIVMRLACRLSACSGSCDHHFAANIAELFPGQKHKQALTKRQVLQPSHTYQVYQYEDEYELATFPAHSATTPHITLHGPVIEDVGRGSGHGRWRRRTTTGKSCSLRIATIREAARLLYGQSWTSWHLAMYRTSITTKYQYRHLSHASQETNYDIQARCGRGPGLEHWQLDGRQR